MGSTITESEIKELANDWYHKLDIHAPLVDALPHVSEDGLEMRFPEATLHTLAEFEGWWLKVIHVFFDELHTPKEVKITGVDGDLVKVHVVVEWQASMWTPPAARSARIVADADQDWVVKRSPRTGKPVIVTYIVNSMKYHEGSATL